MKSRKPIFYIIFFAILVVGFFLALSAVIPGFSKVTIPPIGQVQPFVFENQDGQPVTEKDIAGKVVAVEYFFTTCKGICPKMNRNLRVVYDEFKDQPGFMILSHTSDPATDSAARLKRYADSMGVNTRQWVFLTGRKDSLYNLARHAYKIDDPRNDVSNVEDDFLHTQFIALVNRQGNVVKIYDGLKPSEMKELSREIKKLLEQQS
ncbi:SCO family protein [Paracnuella aquatica]|uniref:SCO family protein n=1 Tax=Paracnuella aquatica TaxID=2268757 RepID=UPI000DEF92E0|nr:SCO family protein [Paracnuella aquatica]RPD44228.1 SCO family protein [Paracnuella aquatica]